MTLSRRILELPAPAAPQDVSGPPVEANLTAQSAESATGAADQPTEPPPPLAPDPLPPKPNGRQPWWQRLVRWARVVA